MKESIKSLNKSTLTTNSELIPILEEVSDLLEEKANLEDIKELPEEISISNFPDTQKVEVTNFPEYPEQKSPIVNVPAPIVNVNVPDVIVPEIKLPTFNIPSQKVTILTDKIEESLNKIKEGIEEVNKELKKVKPSNPSAYPSGVIASSVRVKNTLDHQINPATEDTLSEINVKTPALGQTTMSSSVPVTIASDQTDIVAMSRVHKKVHEGRFFSGGCNNLALANNGVLEMLIQTGVQQTHMVFSCDVSGDATAVLYEGTTFSNAGTTVSMSNHARSSANTFVGTVTHTPTLTTDGTQINGTDFMPGGTKGSGSGGSSQSFAEEFILANSTNYLIRLTNISGGVGKFDIHLAVYQPNL